MALSGPIRTLQQVAKYLRLVLTKLDISCMFADLEWMSVAEATGISFRYHVPSRQAWDSKWKAAFENILQEQVISDVIPINTGLTIFTCFTTIN